MKGLRILRPLALIGALLAILSLAVVACSSEPAEPEITEAQMRNIVADAVSKSMPAPQQQVSAEDIKSMVDTAMMGMSSSQVSASEIQTMVQAAVESAAAGGASASEIETMVRSAVDAATADAVTGSDVQSAVTKAVMDSQSGMITSGDVEKAISSAVMESQAGMITGSDVEKAVSSAVMESQSGMITSGDVEKAISSAVMESQAGMITSSDVEKAVSSAVMEAQSGMVTGADVEKAMSSAVMQAAENSLTAEEIEQIVSKALEERAMMESMMEEVPKETIVFSDLNWKSAQVQNRIAQYIVENGYGYPTDTIFGGTLPNFQGLLSGDIHVTLEIWLPNQSLGWERAVEVGDVVSVGTSLVGDWQSYFVVPKYIADANPDLKTPQDLKMDKFQELFATADSRGKARLIGCEVTWSCEASGAQQIVAYGLTDYVEVITPGSGDVLFADLNGAYEKQAPWLGYMWGTGDPAFNLDLVRLEEPPYTKECWDTDKACSFADSLVLVAVHKSLLPRAPEVIGMLQNWEFTVPTYFEVLRWMNANEGSEPMDAAIWFLNNNKVWESWVTPEAAAAVNDALAMEMDMGG